MRPLILYASLAVSGLALVSTACADLAGLGDFVPAAGGSGVGGDSTSATSNTTGVGGGAGGFGPIPAAGAFQVLGNGDQYVRDVVVHPESGEILLAVTFEGEAILDRTTITGVVGRESSLLARVDTTDGSVVWTTPLADPGKASEGQMFVQRLAINDKGDAVAVGWFDGNITIDNQQVSSIGAMDMFIARVPGSNGTVNYTFFGTTNNDVAAGVAIAPGGGYLVGGHFAGTLDFGGGVNATSLGGIDGYVVHFDGADVAQWALVVTGAGSGIANGKQVVTHVAVTASEEVWVAGVYNQSLEIAGNTHTGSENDDAFIAKISIKTGTVSCSASVQSEALAKINALGVDAQGNVYFGGEISGDASIGGMPLDHRGQQDALLGSLDANCETRFAVTFGDSKLQRVRALTVNGSVLQITGDYDGELSLAGVPENNTGDRDGFTYAFALDGTPIQGWAFGATGIDVPLAMAASMAGEVIIAGLFQGDFAANTVMLSATDGRDGFVLRLAPGNP